MFPVERSDLAENRIPSPHEKRRATLVASPHQNSMWWKRFTLNLSDFGFFLTNLENPTSLNPGDAAEAASS